MRKRPNNKEIARILRITRVIAKMSTSDMAHYLEMYPEEIHAYESGKNEIHYIDYIRWVNILAQLC